ERGRAHRVHLCRNGGHPQGLVHTEQFDLVLMNGGEGDLPTDESLAQAVAEVAHVLAANERDPRHAALLTALLPQSERVQALSGSADRRLRYPVSAADSGQPSRLGFSLRPDQVSFEVDETVYPLEAVYGACY